MALFPCRFRIPITGNCASRHRNASLVYASVYKRDIGIEPHVCGGELGLIGRPSVRQLRRPIMRNLITTIALLALVDSSVAIAQTAGSRNPAAPQPTTSGQQLLPDPAPVGHRQPRADQVPSEKNLMGSERSNQPRERGARPHDQRYLPRLLSFFGLNQ